MKYLSKIDINNIYSINNKNNKFIIIFLILILLIFCIMNNYLNIQENYLTYFKPFQSNETSLLNNFYNNQDYDKNYFKHKFDFNEIYMYSSENAYRFFDEYNKRLIEKSMIYKSNLIKLNDYNENINNLLKNNNSISNISLPIYLNKSEININDINLIANLNNTYLLSITKLKYNIFNIIDISYDTKIGILNEKNTIYFYYKKLFDDLNMKMNKENFVIYDTLQELYNGLKNDEVKIILYFSELPNNELNTFIEYDFNNQIIILPFELNNKLGNLFFLKNDFSKITYFDLNKITQSYLPKKFGNNYYFIYKPTIKLLTLKEILVCNKKISDSLVKDIFDFTFEYQKVFGNSSYQINKIEPSSDLIKYIPYHPVVLKRFRHFGYISNEDSGNCKYFVGVKECTKEVLENNGMYDK